MPIQFDIPVSLCSSPKAWQKNAIHVYMEVLQDSSRPDLGANREPKRMKTPDRSFDLRQALQSFSKFLHQFSAFSCSRRFPPIARRFTSSILGIELPIALFGSRNSTPMAKLGLQRLAVSYSGRGAKSSGGQGNVSFSPCPSGAHYHLERARAHVFRKGRFRAGTWRCPS